MATIGHLRAPSIGLSLHPQPRTYNPRPKPTPRPPILNHGGSPYVFRRFSHPETLPILLSLVIASGCYLGLQKMRQYKSRVIPGVASLFQSKPRWEGKGYRLGQTEDTMREVLLSIEI
ncbi:hypothetical protein FRC08_000905 [Ceratobasidium sp. 394]|nr:hypothetical protein FRC08_000905 [Ceratobasidium sp. 394]